MCHLQTQSVRQRQSVATFVSIGLLAFGLYAQENRIKGQPAPPGLSQLEAVRIEMPADLTLYQLNNIGDEEKPGVKYEAPAAIANSPASPGWQTIFAEGFESVFPWTNWEILHNPAAPYFWNDVPFKPHSGNWSGWCAGGTVYPNLKLNPATDNYVNFMNSWMIYGPFDLSDATEARLDFQYSLDSETYYDHFWWAASTTRNGPYYGYRVSGQTDGYQSQSFDLTRVPGLGNLTGQPEVYIAFVFQSDYSITRRGVFLDDIVLRKFVSPPPSITSTSPSSGQQSTTLEVTIHGTNFANGAGISFSGSGISVNATSFMSATQLTATISIAADAPTGPRDVTVTNPDGQSGTGTGLFTVESRCVSTFWDDFNDGNANGWWRRTPSRWNVRVVEGDPAYCLVQPHPTDDEFSLIDGRTWGDFTMELEGKTTASSNKNFFIFFGVSGGNNYYLQFAVLGVSLYRNGNVIVSTSDDFASDNRFHRIRIERQAPNIKVHVDGRLLIDFDDATSTFGQIGFGSYRSTACFDNVYVSGNCVSQSNTNVTAVDAGDEAEVITDFRLHQNFPNPFNPTTLIRYEIPTYEQVLLRIYNLAGQEVRTLVNGVQNAGHYEISWDARDEQGRGVPSGVYVYRLQAGSYSQVRKMTLLR